MVSDKKDMRFIAEMDSIRKEGYEIRKQYDMFFRDGWYEIRRIRDLFAEKDGIRKRWI